MYEFKYHRPTSVRQAVNMLAKDPEAKLLAGGHSLLAGDEASARQAVQLRRSSAGSKASTPSS